MAPPNNQLTAGPQNTNIGQAGKKPNLKSPRLDSAPELEKVASGARTIKMGDKGRGPLLINQCLYDLGYNMTYFGVIDEFTSETMVRLKEYQKDKGVPVTGILDQATVKTLDQRFKKVKLSPKMLNKSWSPKHVKSILEPWSPKTIQTLQSGVNLYSVDEIYFEDEVWTGSGWVKEKFNAGGGFDTRSNTITFFNDTNEEVASTLYHEVLHKNKPRKGQANTMERETYAYQAGEEFNIGMGLDGHPSIRGKNPNGDEVADKAKVQAYIKKNYPGADTSAPTTTEASSPSDEVIGKGSKDGTVRVRKGGRLKIIERPAGKGERIVGPKVEKNKKKINPKVWK